MKHLKHISVLIALIFLYSPICFAKTIIGRIENVTLPKLGLTLQARVDTGAHTCSLHILNAVPSKVGNETYIDFDTEDGKGNKVHVKTKVIKETAIRSTSGEKESRYVIREEVQLGKIKKLVNINLNDRSNLKNNFLVGRNFLRGDFLVDVSLSRVMDNN